MLSFFRAHWTSTLFIPFSAVPILNTEPSMSDYAKAFGVVGNTLIFALGGILVISLARHYEPEEDRSTQQRCSVSSTTYCCRKDTVTVEVRLRGQGDGRNRQRGCHQAMKCDCCQIRHH